MRDLALIRVTDLELSSLVPGSSPDAPTTKSENSANSDIEHFVERSYDFVQEARNAIKILNRGDVDTQGGKVESVRSQLEDVLKGLEHES